MIKQPDTQAIRSGKKTTAFRTIDIAYIAIGVALLTVCSWISIPTPVTVPFTLQTFAVFFLCYLLGGARGTMTVIVYLLLGAAGAPVFAEMSGGISVLLRPTGGYLIGFLFSALLMWFFERFAGKKIWIYGISMVLALIVCYTFGTLWFVHVYIGEDGNSIGTLTALSWCVLPYLLPDAVKIALALTLGSNKALHRVINTGARN